MINMLSAALMEAVRGLSPSDLAALQQPDQE
jgi:hypothetical protein